MSLKSMNYFKKLRTRVNPFARVYDHNGEPNNGWRLNLETARLETWPDLLEGSKGYASSKASACQREIDTFEERIGENSRTGQKKENQNDGIDYRNR